VTDPKQEWCEANGGMRFAGGVKSVFFYHHCGLAPAIAPPKPDNVPAGDGATWCTTNKFLLTSHESHKNYYCSKCRCPLPPVPEKAIAQPKMTHDFCDQNRYMIDGPQAEFYYSKCGGRPEVKKVEVPEPKAQQVVNIAPPSGDGKQVHVHVNVAAPKVVQSNAGLQAMVTRVAKKNQQAADKMDAILRKLKSQDCRGGNCLPQTHKEMEQWKADWVLETEETGSIVP
jgi:hypothetical protein